VKRYSEFINFPIYLWATKEVDVEVPAEEDESIEEEESSNSLFHAVYFSYKVAMLCICGALTHHGF
jgi:HSP90 family molecular chaperone